MSNVSGIVSAVLAIAQRLGISDVTQRLVRTGIETAAQSPEWRSGDLDLATLCRDLSLPRTASRDQALTCVLLRSMTSEKLSADIVREAIPAADIPLLRTLAMDYRVSIGGERQARHVENVLTPEGAFAIISPVAEKLIAAGVISRDALGALRGRSRSEVLKQAEELGVCDFCSGPEAPHTIITPDFEMGEGTQWRSTGGWGACDTCYEMAQQDRRSELLQRAIESNRAGKFGAAGIKALHEKFWKAREDLAEAAGIGAALADYIEDRLPKDIKQTLTEKDKRVDAVRKLTGLAEDELAALARGDMAYKKVSSKLVAWHKKYGTDYDGARRLAELMEQEARRPLVGAVPHWQRALDAKYEALRNLTAALRSESSSYYTPEVLDMKDPVAVKQMVERARAKDAIAKMGFGEDLRRLRLAEAYSFNAETIGAIREAARSIPHESPLSSVETPVTGAGWFWFHAPLPVASSPVASDVTHALLWGWEGAPRPEPAIAFAAYVVDERGTVSKGQVLPSTRWYWPLSMTLHEMLAFNTVQHRKMYGPGTALEHAPELVGEEQTMKDITELSLFFLAACLWFKAKVLVSAPGHVERHARKRYEKEHKLTEREQPKVHVVALREALRDPAPAREPGAEATTRDYQCRWIVKGHPRLQVCGPGRADRKLIWIDPHPAGPADKPLRTREKVYAVIR